ncbi:MAG: zinc ribbon domain-containing protein [Chloroflexota bacterium]
MELGAIFLLLAVLAIVVMFVVKPFTSQWRSQAEGKRETSSLLAERDQILVSIKELDFDHSLGKIPEEVYSVQRSVLLQRGAEVLRQLDEIRGAQPASAELRSESDAGAGTGDTNLLSDDELDDLLAKRRLIRKEKALGFCPKCGKPILQSDRFCPSCGQAIS